MSTTVIFAELLIIGMQAVIWLGIFAIALFGNPCLDPVLHIINVNTTISGIVFLGLAYTLGILVDMTTLILSRILRPKNFILKCLWLAEELKAPDYEQRIEIIKLEGKATEFLAYIRSRLRILRGTCFNLLMFILAWISLVSYRGGFPGYQFTLSTSFMVCGLALGAAIYCFSLAGIAEVAYDNRLVQILQNQAYKESNENQQNSQAAL